MWLSLKCRGMGVTGRLPGTRGWRPVERYGIATQIPNLRVVRLDEALTYVNVAHVKEQLVEGARELVTKRKTRGETADNRLAGSEWDIVLFLMVGERK
jgi:MFS superfamily sulfate permease-like transporter